MQLDLLTECRNIKTNEIAQALGQINMIMFACQRSSVFQMRTLAFWLLPALEHKQIAVLFDKASTPIGYMTWAHLAADTEQRLLSDPHFLLHPSEWNEGGRTWIIDYCFPLGGVRESITTLKGALRAADIKAVSWARRRNDYSIKHIRHCLLVR